ncbi:MAG TPA: hypothetical protein VGH14_08930 [Solirubrobacterales bacterium]|jgi:hypothetical protein
MIVAASARAQQYPPAPKGEDIAFLQLGAVGELVTLELYRSAAHSKAFDADDRRTFKRLAAQTSKGWLKLNSLLGEGAISREIFSVKIPADVLRSPPKTTALAVHFESLLTGLYLSGVEGTMDPPTRLLIGRHLSTGTRDLTILRDLHGPHMSMRAPEPLSVEYVGEQFDHYLAIPGA